MARKYLGAAASGTSDLLKEDDLSSLFGAYAGFRNRIINGNFAVNQRVKVSGTALAAAAYGHDRWKAGASGCTYTFTAAKPDTTITITAGTLTQVIEDANIEGGVYTLSWTGTATARVYQGTAQGSYAASPITTSSLTAGTATTTEFTGGSFGKVQFEPGSTATSFERRPISTETLLCQRYYERTVVCTLQSPAAGFLIQAFPFKVTKRIIPTGSTVTAPTYTSATGAIVNSTTIDAYALQFQSTATSGSLSGWVVDATAEL